MKKALVYKPDVIKAFTDGWRYGTGEDLTSMNLATLSAIVEDAHRAGIKVFTPYSHVEWSEDSGASGS
jgi:hypothetical protein